MGHRTIEITFKIYHHLMPGSLGTAAKTLNLCLAASTVDSAAPSEA
ncbi:hypothetical protein [Streptomyces hirsutus]